MTNAEYGAAKAANIVGGKITGVFTDFEKEFWGIQVTKDDRIYNVWIYQDAEGNGPGAIDIQEVKDE